METELLNLSKKKKKNAFDSKNDIIFFYIGPFIILDLNAIACDVRKHNNKAIAKEPCTDVVSMLYLLHQETGSTILVGTFGLGINSKQAGQIRPVFNL